MKRPDLGAIEWHRHEAVDEWGERNSAWNHVATLIAYARRLEANQSDLRRITEGCDKRIAELEEALQPFANAHRYPECSVLPVDLETAASVLNRKGT